MFVRLVRALCWAVGGYVVGAALTFALVRVLSTNTHDRSVEAAMTAAFVGGPLGAIVGLVAALSRRSAPAG